MIFLKWKSLLDRIGSWPNFVGTSNFLTEILAVCGFNSLRILTLSGFSRATKLILKARAPLKVFAHQAGLCKMMSLCSEAGAWGLADPSARVFEKTPATCQESKHMDVHHGGTQRKYMSLASASVQWWRPPKVILFWVPTVHKSQLGISQGNRAFAVILEEMKQLRWKTQWQPSRKHPECSEIHLHLWENTGS